MKQPQLDGLSNLFLLMKFCNILGAVPLSVYGTFQTERGYADAHTSKIFINNVFKLIKDSKKIVLSKQIYDECFFYPASLADSKYEVKESGLSLPFDKILIEVVENDIIDVPLFGGDFSIINFFICENVTFGTKNNFYDQKGLLIIANLFDGAFFTEHQEKIERAIIKNDRKEMLLLFEKFFHFLIVSIIPPFTLLGIPAQLAALCDNVFSKNKLKFAADKINFREKVKIDGKNHLIKVKDYIIVDTKKSTYNTSVLTGNHVDWKFKWEVRGHWRAKEGIGKNKQGDYCIEGMTWVNPFEKGKGELKEKIRIYK